MLDIKLVRENPEAIKLGLRAKKDSTDIDQLLALDAERREAITQVETLKSKQNDASKQISQAKRNGDDATAILAEMKEISQTVAALGARREELDAELTDRLLRIPNPPHSSVPAGESEEDNPVVRSWGEPRGYDFELKDHVDIAEDLGLYDFKRGAKLSGSGFVLQRGQGARLTRALISFCLDHHTLKHGFEEVSTPFVVRPEAMVGTSQLPKFGEDMYALPEDDLYLIPTAEVPVTNIYREEVLTEEELPKHLCGYTPCFRREAGSHGKDTRGMKRVHQFDKVEMVKLVKPEESYAALESLTVQAEEILQALGLHYRVIELCTADLSFGAAKCYDIELWSPGAQSWLEVSSCSNFEDFQARRANIRFKPSQGGKPQFVHTLNGSGVAMPRLIIALLETYQRADGTVEIPEALRPYMGGLSQLG